MTMKQYYLSKINEGMLKEDEEMIRIYEEKLNNLLKEEFEERVKTWKETRRTEWFY